MASSVLPQYPLAPAPMAAPMAAPAMVGAPMIGDPSTAQPLVYAEPGCGYVEPGCAYMGTVGYGPQMMPMGDASCCEGGVVDGAVMGTPTEPYVDPQPMPES
jgi:hypothetical protein